MTGLSYMSSKTIIFNTSSKIAMFILQVSVNILREPFSANQKHKAPSCGNTYLVLREKHYAMLTIHIDTLKYVLMTTFS